MSTSKSRPRRLTRAELESTAQYVARMVLRAAPSRRLLVLRQWGREFTAEQEAEVVSVTAVRLAQVVDSLGELSPVAREYLRDEIAKVGDSFKAAGGGRS